MNTYINRYITSVKNIFSNLKDKNVNDNDYTCNFFKQCSDSINLFKNMNDDIYNNLLRVSLNDKLNYVIQRSKRFYRFTGQPKGL